MRTIKRGPMFDSKKEFNGYAELYEEIVQVPGGFTIINHVLGDMYIDPSDKPKRWEYSISKHKHIGTVKVELKLVE